MNFMTNLNVKRSCVSLVCLLLLVILTFNIVSERREMVYYAPGNRLKDESLYCGEIIESVGVQHLSGDGEPSIANLSLDEGQDRLELSRRLTASIYTSSLTSLSSYLSTKYSSPSSGSSVASVSKYIRRSGSAYNSDTSRTNNFSSGHFQSTNDNELSMIYNNSYILNALVDFNPVKVAKDLNQDVENVKTDIKGRENNTLLNETGQNVPSSEQLHRYRIQRITNACGNKEELFKNKVYRGHTIPVMYRSKDYNFTYCKVPKSGSTFWTKVFGVLKYGSRYADDIFKRSRTMVHGSMLEYITSVSSVIKNKSRTIIVSRDPYSRLFSAYIDKSFLQLMPILNYYIRNIAMDELYKSNVCLTDVTFQEFLEWIVKEGQSGKTLNRHWAPIFSLCYPCAINPFILVKQETFGRDVEFALQQLGVEKSTYDYITLALHDHRAELSLPGIIETLFLFARKAAVRSCLGFVKFTHRIWISLQIQGYIEEKIEFPVEKFSKDQFSNETYFTEIVLQTLRNYPMSSSQSKSQRQKYLYRAYRSVKPETLQRVQDLYKQDFEMFGYSKLPPTEILTRQT